MSVHGAVGQVPIFRRTIPRVIINAAATVLLERRSLRSIKARAVEKRGVVEPSGAAIFAWVIFNPTR